MAQFCGFAYPNASLLHVLCLKTMLLRANDVIEDTPSVEQDSREGETVTDIQTQERIERVRKKRAMRQAKQSPDEEKRKFSNIMNETSWHELFQELFDLFDFEKKGGIESIEVSILFSLLIWKKTKI